MNRNISSAVAAATMTMEAVPANSERILVIEDDRAVQKALKRLFEGEGFAVDIAGNGAAGLEMFRAAAPAVLVLDAWAGRVPRNQPDCSFVADHHS